MKLILISSPFSLQNETEILNYLLQSPDIYAFHLRKPHDKLLDIELLLQKIHPKFYSKIMIHHHHSLAEKYGLKGVHFGSGQFMEEIGRAKYYTSKAVHQLDEILSAEGKYDYLLFSPVFKSISKKGYHPIVSQKDLYDFLNSKTKPQTSVWALGGISPENIISVKALGFTGAAVMGYLWEDFPTPNKVKTRFEALCKALAL